MNRKVIGPLVGLLGVLMNPMIHAQEQGRTIELALPLSGVVQQVLVEAGQRVQRGELLLKIDPRRYQYRLNRAEAALKAVQVEAEDMALELSDQLELYERMVTTESELKRVQRAAAKVDAQVAQRAAERDEAALDLEQTVLKSPLGGVVVQRLAEPGEVLSRHHPAPVLLLQVAE